MGPQSAAVEERSLLKRLLRLPGVEERTLGGKDGYQGDVVGEPPRGAKQRYTDQLDPTISMGHANRTAETVQRLGGWPYAVLSAVAFAGVDYLAIISVEAERPAPGGSRPTRELAGQGIGCIASGMAGSAPVGGSLTRSMLAGMIGKGDELMPMNNLGIAGRLMGLVCGFATMGLAFPQVTDDDDDDDNDDDDDDRDGHYDRGH
ncbi:hypothetical protein AK812_SmicGene28048 [Symbiodinium microadriaticum]|uniref:Uncharacterized protein n=1 Tax=Symbiodinium microadriaticum TaxID=2951 RepID=A0A1Q9D5E3_SYMMI|nr:hypothetical protein AK812_SmicGene28048 [Symbiodinium microadriaticum]